jgi:hypothetical protein
MFRIYLIAGFLLLVFSCCPSVRKDHDLLSLALERKDDLQLSVFITAHAVDRLLSTDIGRREAISLLKANAITKVFIEVYRSGLVVHKNCCKR